MDRQTHEIARRPHVRSGGRIRPAVVGLGLAYALGLTIYAAARPRAAEVIGLLELANTFAPWWYAPVPTILSAGLGLRSRALLLGGLAAAAAFLATWWPLFAPRHAPTSASGRDLTVMTLNVLADNPKHGELAAAIAAEDPDVVALQELEPDAAADHVGELAGRYPHHALVPETKRGAGVLSKYPLRAAEPLRLSEGGNWNQHLVVEAPLGRLTLFNVHPAVPRLHAEGPGPFGLPIVYDTARRSAEVARLVELVDGADGPVIVTGDFNLSEYGRDYRLLQLRLGDAYRSAGGGFGHTFPRAGSFPRNLPAPWPVVRLDYVWHSPDLQPLAADVGPSGGSDHRSVVVRLEKAEGR